MIGNNNFYFNYNNFLLNNSNFISPSQNVGINNNFNKKPENSTKANIDTASLSQDTEINENKSSEELKNLALTFENMVNTSNTKSSICNVGKFNSTSLQKKVNFQDTVSNIYKDKNSLEKEYNNYKINADKKANIDKKIRPLNIQEYTQVVHSINAIIEVAKFKSDPKLEETGNHLKKILSAGKILSNDNLPETVFGETTIYSGIICLNFEKAGYSSKSPEYTVKSDTLHKLEENKFGRVTEKQKKEAYETFKDLKLYMNVCLESTLVHEEKHVNQYYANEKEAYNYEMDYLRTRLQLTEDKQEKKSIKRKMEEILRDYPSHFQYFK